MVITKKRISDHILWAEINRPGALNAIDFEVLDKLETLATEIEQDDEIRVFILSGTGNRTFVSGGDLKKFHTIKNKDKMVTQARRIQRLLLQIEELPCWTVAHINGDAYGGGIELMLAFDFRLSVPEAQFGFTQGRFYLVPGWGGLTRLVEKVGRTKALEWQGKSEVLTAKQVLEHGMIEHILPGNHPQKETLQWVENLTKNDRKYIQTLKKNAFRMAEHRRKAMEAETEPFARLWVDEQHIARVEAFMNKEIK